MGKSKQNKSRPAGTSALSEPLIAESSSPNAVSAFSPSGDLFAHVSLAVDKHRLRVYSTQTGRAVAELTLSESRIQCVKWLDIASPSNNTAGETQEAPKKRRRKAEAPPTTTESTTQHFIALGLVNGSIALFSPSQNAITRTLTDIASTAAILSLAFHPRLAESTNPNTLWTTGADGALRSWSLEDGMLLQSSTTPSTTRTPYSAIAIDSTATSTKGTQILAAHHSIELLHAKSSSLEETTPRPLATFTGHASPVTTLQWVPWSSSKAKNARSKFVSIAESDRILSVWELPTPSSSSSQTVPEGSMIASIPLDSSIRYISLSNQYDSQASPNPIFLLAISSSGTLRIFPLPTSSSSSPAKPTLVTSVGGSTCSASSGPPILSARFVSINEVQIVRLVNGIRPVFDSLIFRDTNNEFIANIQISPPSAKSLGLTSEADDIIVRQRYTEGEKTTIGSGLTLPVDANLTPLPEGELDAELAEISLGERLAPRPATTEASNASTEKSKSTNAELEDITPAPLSHPKDSLTLTRTLTQALHSTDKRLLESVLIHTNAELIMNTVRSLPPALCVPLLNACVERLNRGKREGTSTGAGAQRGTGLLRWIRAVLVGHTAYLLTVPQVVARLGSLHATLTSRLMLQERLLALNGRLDLVLTQAELRSSNKPANPSARVGGAADAKTKEKVSQKKKPRKQKMARYVEGESEDEAAEMEMDGGAEVEVGSDDEGSVEDVELGGSDEGEDDDDEDDDEGFEAMDVEGDDDDESAADSDEWQGVSSKGGKANGFLDDEAEETWAEDESEESEEE